MSLILSRPQNETPWREVLTSALAAWLLPGAVGMLLLLAFTVVGTYLPEMAALSLWAGGTLLMLSPFVSFAGMMLAVPFAVLLIRLGWFGWVPAAATGLSVGAVLGAMMEYALAAPFGAAALLIFRATLGVLRPLT